MTPRLFDGPRLLKTEGCDVVDHVEPLCSATTYDGEIEVVDHPSEYDGKRPPALDPKARRPGPWSVLDDGDRDG